MKLCTLKRSYFVCLFVLLPTWHIRLSLLPQPQALGHGTLMGTYLAGVLESGSRDWPLRNSRGPNPDLCAARMSCLRVSDPRTCPLASRPVSEVKLIESHHLLYLSAPLRTRVSFTHHWLHPRPGMWAPVPGVLWAPPLLKNNAVSKTLWDSSKNPRFSAQGVII